MRRRESKKMLSNKPVSNSSTCQYSTQETLATGTNDEGREEQKQVILKIDTIGNGTSLCEKLLGLSLGMSEAKELFITNIIPGGPAQLSNELKIGKISRENWKNYFLY